MYHKSPSEYSDTLSYSFLRQISMLAACLINGGPNLLNSEYICQLHCLFASILAVVDTIHTRGTTHVAFFLTVGVARIDLALTLRFEKGFGIFPSYKLFK